MRCSVADANRALGKVAVRCLAVAVKQVGRKSGVEDVQSGVVRGPTVAQAGMKWLKNRGAADDEGMLGWRSGVGVRRTAVTKATRGSTTGRSRMYGWMVEGRERGRCAPQRKKWA